MSTNVTSAALVEENFRLEGLDCPDCARKLGLAIARIPGVEEAEANLINASLYVCYHPGIVTRGIIFAQVKAMGYGIEPLPEEEREAGEEDKEGAAQGGKFLTRLFSARITGLTAVVSGLLFVLGLVGEWTRVLPGISRAAYLLAIIIGGLPVARKGWTSIKKKIVDMNVLMTVAVIGAVLIGEWTEGAAVAFLFTVSELLESYTMERTRRSIRSLMDPGITSAMVKRQGKEVVIPIKELREGDLVIVRPGERIAVDGKVISGESAVNQAPITGESVPALKKAGDEVFAGTVNGDGVLDVLAVEVGVETTMARIARLVEEAQARKAPAEKMVDRFARYYTPVVMGLAAVMMILPPLLWHVPWPRAIYRSLALLVVACPCAFVISTPVTIVSGLGAAAKHGILIKGGAYLEALSSLKALAFDKTGTLTLGQPQVTGIAAYGISREEAMRLAASLERRSEHPLAAAIVRAAGTEGVTADLEVQEYRRLNGLGVQGRINGEEYVLGSPRLLEDRAETPARWDMAREEVRRREEAGETALVLWTPARVAAVFALADVPREEAVEAMKRLKGMDLQNLVMLTGDHAAAARHIGSSLSLDEVRADLRPEEKLKVVEELLEKYNSVGMVGDGINDTPALARATVGIAMGAAGTAAALEAADVALITDDLSHLPAAISLSRMVMRVLRQNITLAVGIKFLAVVLAAGGLLTLWLGVAADMGVSLLVTMNGMRLLASKVR